MQPSLLRLLGFPFHQGKGDWFVLVPTLTSVEDMLPPSILALPRLSQPGWGLQGPRGCRGGVVERLWCFSGAFPSTTETLAERESSQSGPTPPEETEAQVRPSTGEGRKWEGQGREMLMLCLHQGDLEGDDHDTELPGSGDTVVPGDMEETPVGADLGPDAQDPEDQSFPQSLPSPPSAGAVLLVSLRTRRRGCGSSHHS